MSAMVELDRLSKSFGSFTALKEVSFQIAEGEFMTFLGPSGCGKTTCLRMISGFETPTTGRVLIAGQDVTLDPPYRRNVNQVFQSYALFPHLNIRENIAFGLRMKRFSSFEIKKRVENAIEITSLGAFADRKPTQLSGGQRQRVALARAIVCEPKVLLLDEPLSALDAKLRQQMRLELKSLQKRLGMTFIFVTHDQEEALTMSDRIAVMNQGEVEQIGTVSEIYYRPQTRFVASFIGDTNIIEAKVTGLSEGVLSAQAEGGLSLKVKTEVREPGPEILLSLRPEKIQLFREKPPGHNVFPGTVSLEIFKGAIDELIVKTESGLDLSVCSANDGAGHKFHEGDLVFFRIQPEDICLVKS